ncbi:MAG: GIY-YIG nuclease family protein, partial [Pseudomonadales bacterium]
MNERFLDVIDSLHPSFERLLEMEPVSTTTLPKGTPKSGVYLFTHAGSHLYVGRSNRLSNRIRNHGSDGSKHNVAAFAFKIARRATGKTKATYKTEGSRKDLVKQPEFAKAFL